MFDYFDYLTTQETREMRDYNRACNWELLPVQGANNRAYIKRMNGVIYLKSYRTVVFSYNPETGEFARYWGGYSATTLKHVQMFICYISGIEYRRNSTIGKSNWDSMPVEKCPIW